MLQALVAMVEECNVTKAASRLMLTQPALSIIIKKLRDTFKDQLFVYANNKMLPTQCALNLYHDAKDILQKIFLLEQNTISFNPKTSTRNFYLAMPDFRAAVLLPRIMKKLEELSSPINITISHIENCSDVKIYTKQNIDLGISHVNYKENLLHYQTLIDDEPVIIGNKNNKVFKKKITIERLLSAKRVEFIKDDFSDKIIPEKYVILLKQNNENVVATTDTIFSLLYYIKHSNDVISIFLNNISNLLKQDFNLSMKPLPFQVKSTPIYLIWHTRSENDIGLQWLKSVICEVML